MGTLTDDMTRVCDEMDTMRRARQSLIRDVARASSTRRAAVSDMLGGFSRAHNAMAKEMRADLSAFSAGTEQAVRTLRRDVANQQAQFRAEMEDARQAWLGLAPTYAAPEEAGGVEEMEVTEPGQVRRKKRKR